MEIYKGKRITFDGNEDINEFAKSILALVNAKSNNYGVIDIKTVIETNLILVEMTDEMYKNNEDILESMVGKILEIEEIELLEMDLDDIKHKHGTKFLEILYKYWDNEENPEPIIYFAE